MIRLACHGDEIALIELSKRCYVEMDFDSFGYRFEYAAGVRNYQAGIDNPAIVIAVSVERGVVNGLMVYLINDSSQYFDNHRHAQEIVYHADPALRARDKIQIMSELFDFADRELARRGVKSSYTGTDIRCKGIQSLLREKGCIPISVQLYKEVQP